VDNIGDWIMIILRLIHQEAEIIKRAIENYQKDCLWVRMPMTLAVPEDITIRNADMGIV